MYPSTPRLLRVLPRSTLTSKILPAPAPQITELNRPTLMDALQKQKEKAGDSWPQNIRLEPVVKKEAFKHVQADVRTRLKRLLRET
ncbi:hypothetical protein AMATHDRAFT_63754, partial [Amanita thiersii Skay4041]